MKTKPIFAIILIALLSSMGGVLRAYDFSYTYQGKTLNYDTTSSNTVQVSRNNSLDGDIIIPSQVTYNSTIYSVTSIGNSAFWYCSSLTSVTIPNSVTSIGNSAFWNCISLTSVTIPNSVTSIGNSAFGYCSSLTSVTIPNSVISIGNSVFGGCSSLTSIEIPNSVISIGNSAFWYCSSLTSVTIPSSVTSIGNYAFWYCSSLTSVTIPNSVTSIGNSAFWNCISLTSVTIPNSVTSIGNSVFGGCSSLTSVTIPNSVTSIGNSAFGDCISLTSVNIPSLVTSIGSKTFYHCINLTNIDMDTLSSLTYIDSNAFEECISLTSFEIPSTLTSIGNNVFKGCVSLDTIICRSTTPPLISNVSAFEDLPTDAILLVPCTAVNTYKSKGTWLRFKNYTYSYETSSQEISATICANETYNFNGKILTASGIYTDTLKNTNGCDSVITLTLNTYPSFENPVIEQVIYEGDSVNFMGNTLTHAGIYKDTLQTINGCDSIFTMKIFTLPKDTITVVQHDTVTLYDTITQIIYDTIIRPCARVYAYIYATINEGEKYSDYGFTKTEAGTYTNIFKTEDGCDSVVVLYLSVLSGLDEVETSQIMLYPNPTNEKVYLSVTNIPDAEITIRDIQGNVVKKENVLANETEFVLDVKDLASGTYTIMLSNDKTRVTKKLIKR